MSDTRKPIERMIDGACGYDPNNPPKKIKVLAKVMLPKDAFMVEVYDNATVKQIVEAILIKVCENSDMLWEKVD